MNVYRVKTGSILPLGKQGENLARKIQFDISRWISTFGPGTVQLLHQRSGDEAPYPVAVYREGNFAVWTVTDADTAAPGTGHAELQYYVGDALAKSETWMTKVFPALGPAGETPPEAQQGWVDQVLAQVARITGMTAQAVELPAGSAPTADYADGVLTIGIPLGGDVSEAQIAQAVAEYLSKNPITETDPTVPDWAKQPEKPSYTADEVGALPDTTHIPSTADDVNAEPAGAVSQHNVSDAAHSDLRLLIQGLTERLNALADSDDTTLDQLSEIVAYIKSNRSLIEAITTDKVGVGDIVNDLVTNVANKPLSAAQGVALKALIDAINAVSIGAIPAPATATVGQTIRVSAVDENGQPTEWEAVDMASGDGGEKWELIKTLNFTEDTYSIDLIETDNDGQPFELTAYQVFSKSGSVSANQMFRLNPFNSGYTVSSTNAYCEPTWNTNGFLFAQVKIEVSGAIWYKTASGSTMSLRFAGKARSNITQINWCNFGSSYIKAGAVVEIWGIRS